MLLLSRVWRNYNGDSMSRLLSVFIIVVTAIFAFGQSSSELPSAPSAVLKQRNQPSHATAPAQTSDSQSNTATQGSTSTTSGTSGSGAETQTPANSGTNQAPQQNNGVASVDTSAKQKSQSTGSKSDDEAATTIRTVVNEVNLIFTVTDKHGRFIKDLKVADIALLDDNKPPAKVEDFRSETDLPLREIGRAHV